MLSLLLKSMRSRIIPTSLVTISLMASMVLLLSIERIQQGAEEGFNQSISGVDAIIGPRSSSLELVLYTVFHLGRPTNNITTKTIDDVKQRSDIKLPARIAIENVATNAETRKRIATAPQDRSKKGEDTEHKKACMTKAE